MKCYDLKLDNEGKCYLAEVGRVACGREFLFSAPNVIYQFMRDEVRMHEMAEEHVYMLALNTKCRALGLFEVSRGSVNWSIINPRECFIRALMVGASSIVLVHNHPSQDVSPSKDDIQVTHRMKETGMLIGIPLSDHVIVGNGYYSFVESGKYW